MNFILAEDFKYPLTSFRELITEKFPQSSIINCNKTNISSVLKTVDKPPPFTKGWLIFVNSRDISPDVINVLGSGDNCAVYVVNNQESLDLLVQTFMESKVKFQTINNLNPSKESILRYIEKTLNVDTELAQYIYRRHRGYVPKIVETVEIMLVHGIVTKADIKKYTTASTSLSWDGLFQHIIGVKPASSKKVMALVKQYQYGMKYLLKFLVKRFELYIMVHELAAMGELSLSNYKEYRRANAKKFKDVTDYRVQVALESIGVVSYEKLVYLYLLYKRLDKSTIAVGEFLALLRLSKED